MDRRVYNGCLSDDLKTEFEYMDSLLGIIHKIEPEACCTYFPMEGKYQVHVWGKPISGLYVSKVDALQDALNNLNK